MQGDLEQEGLPLSVQILGVNAIGAEGGNDLICQGRHIPWLQDTPEQRVWSLWGVVWRDVFVLNERNEVVAIYNLTVNDLREPEHYQELRSIIAATAQGGGGAPVVSSRTR
jgi:hypothetical protein